MPLAPLAYMRTSRFSVGSIPRFRGMRSKVTSTLSITGAIETSDSPSKDLAKSKRSLTGDPVNVQKWLTRVTYSRSSCAYQSRGIYSRRFADSESQRIYWCETLTKIEKDIAPRRMRRARRRKLKCNNIRTFVTFVRFVVGK